MDQCGRVIDYAGYADCVGTKVGTDQKRLRCGVADAANGREALHFFKYMFEFCSKRCVLDVVDIPLQADLWIISGHTAARSAQMRMVVGAEEYIADCVVMADCAEKASHSFGFLSYSPNTRCIIS